MNDYKEKLMATVEDNLAAVKYLEIIASKTYYRENDKKVLMIQEGKTDKSYYNHVFNLTLDDKYEIISVGDKKMVLELLEMSKKIKILELEIRFFVDKDYDENYIENNHLYITPCYSIENFYIDESCMERILKGEFDFDIQIEEDRVELEKILTLYKETQKVYIERIKEIVYWYYLQKKKNEAKNGAKHAKLTNFKVITSRDTSKRSLITLKNMEIIKTYTTEDLERLTENSNSFLKKELEEVQNYFEGLNPLTAFRGKYLFEFFEHFILVIAQDGRRKKNHLYFNKQRRNRISNDADFMKTLSQYSIKPECLKIFLADLKAIIETN